MNRFLLILWFVLLTASTSLAAISDHVAIDSLLPGPGAFAPVARAGDSYWRDSVPESIRRDFIAQGERHLGKAWQSIPATLFSRFRLDGNRTAYEEFIFGKRNQLVALVMAEVMEGEGRFLPDIADGLQSLCEESWWGIPAHYGPETPQPDSQPLDLFSAETGALAAWTYYMLGPQLAKSWPGLVQRVRAEVQRRIRDEALAHREWWRGAGMNWNPWICSNWLACVLLVESDRDKQLEAVAEIAQSLEGFIDQYPDDGGCDEGVSYWDRATGSLLDALVLLDRATKSNGPGDLQPLIINIDNDKLQAMARYVNDMAIGNGYFVNFADALVKVRLRPEWFVGAAVVGSNPLMSLTSEAAVALDYMQAPSRAFFNDNFGALGRELMLLSIIGELQAAQAELPYDTWLPRLQVIAARSVPNSTDGIYFAAKGGNNDESHNHNDVGSCIVYVDGQPLFIDPGRATYTANTFNERRYEAWNTQSGYHNLPIINGHMQSQGASHKATDVVADIKKNRVKFGLDISQAYSADTGLETLRRTYDFARGKSLAITDACRLSQDGCIEEVFISPVEPKLLAGCAEYEVGGRVWRLDFDPNYTATIERITLDDPYMLDSWGTALHRLVVKAPVCGGKESKIKFLIKEK